MPLKSQVFYLPENQSSCVDATIRAHRYTGVERIRAELASAGVAIKKSALHRYMQKLKASDQLHHGTPDNTVVVIVDRATGSTMSLTTTAAAEAVAAAITKLRLHL
jgi:hypothetical protein